MAEEPGEVTAPDSHEVRSDIERTRARIASTVGAIEERLQPRRLASDARRSMTDAAARRVEAMRTNPVPAMLVGLAIAVVAAAVFRRRRQRRRLEVLEY